MSEETKKSLHNIESWLGLIGLLLIIAMLWQSTMAEDDGSGIAYTKAVVGLALILFMWLIFTIVYKLVLLFNWNDTLKMALAPTSFLFLLMAYSAINGMGVPNILPHSWGSATIFSIIVIDLTGLGIFMAKTGWGDNSTGD